MRHEKCFHCHEDIPSGLSITAIIDGSAENMCCYGCKAVAEFIAEAGHCEFYDYRGSSEPAASANVSEKKWLKYDENIVFEAATTKKEKLRILSIRLDGMYCSACGWLIDKHMSRLKGIFDVKLNAITKMLQLEFDPTQIKLSQILSSINHLGYQPIISVHGEQQKGVENERKDALKRLVVAGFGMMFIMTLAVPLYSAQYKDIEPAIHRFFELISLLVATAVFFYSGKSFIKNAYRDLKNKHLGMDVPVALSISLAYGASVWNVLSYSGQTIYFDSMVMFVFFLLAGRFVEMSVRHQGMNSREALGAMVPTSVTIINKRKAYTAPIEQLKKGDIIKVKQGETVAIDGSVIKGQASLDESLLTGESESVSKSTGDTVLAGSQVKTGAIEVKSTAIGDETILSGLAQLLEKAQLQKPKVLLLVDKVASWFVAIVLILASLTAIYYQFNDPDRVFITVLSVLVATCPCALSLATPAALTTASVKLIKNGILVNNLDAITKINKIKQWYFDKTGTLTEPQMALLKTHLFGSCSEAQVIKIAATLEHQSVHPIASAFANFYDGKLKTSHQKEIANKGIEATIAENKYRIGSKQWCEKESKLSLLTDNSSVYLSKNGSMIAAFELHNPLRKGAKSLVDELVSEHRNIIILSGDKRKPVQKTANQLTISEYYFEQSPQQKIERIKNNQLKEQVLMVGDGINDAPVLAQSDVSISFNQGTQLARTASDFIIMGHSVKNIGVLLAVSNKTNAIIKQNIIWALLYNISVTPLAMMGYLQPWMAAIGMSVSSLVVTLNAKRILILPKSR